MKILIDADGSPVRKIVVRLAKKYQIRLLIISNVNHDIDEDYGDHIMVDSGFDQADHEIIKHLEKGDLVITQDYGLASLVLAKKGLALHQNGWFYRDETIDALLQKRYFNQQMRKIKKRPPHIPKRSVEDNIKFEKALENYLKSLTTM